jgi:hypothetical protein
MNLFLLLSCLLCADGADSSFSSILKRVSLRDSTTHAIIAVNFADDAERDACLAPQKTFEISMIDSQSFSVTLSPMYSGYIGGCLPIDRHEEYRFKFSHEINGEYLRFCDYTKLTRIADEKNRKEFETKVLRLTKYPFTHRTSICTVLDSLGENCSVDHFRTCDTVLGLYEGGCTLRYPNFTLIFRCNRAYCFLKNIFTNAEFQKDNSCFIPEKELPPNLNLIKRNCMKK